MLSWDAKRNPLSRVSERSGRKPPEGWSLGSLRVPDGPVILRLSNPVSRTSPASSWPARELIEGIKCGRRASLKSRRTVWIAKRAKIEKHRHAAALFTCVDDSLAQKGVSEPVCAVRWVGHNIAPQRLRGLQKIHTPLPETSVDQVG